MSVTITPTEMSVDTPVTVDGTVTAGAFVGDGAGLTGVELTAHKDQPNGYPGLDADGILTAPHVRTVASIAALKATPGAAGRTVSVAGYYAAGDGGGGEFFWDAASTATPDDAIIVQVTGTATGRWRRQCEEMCFNVLWFGAKGDNSTDDTAALQKALDAARGPWDSVNNRPQRWYDAVVQGNGPQGSKVYLPGGPPSDQPFRTYKITAPLKVWPHTEFYGDGTTTMVNGQAVPLGRAAIEFQYVNIDGWWHDASYFHDFKLMSGGHGFASDPAVVATFTDRWLNSGVGYCRFHRITFMGHGWGIWLPGLAPGWTKGQYSQEVEVDDFLHINPCTGGIALSGNLNFIRRYAIVDGFGAWDEFGFTSPWDSMGRGQIDLGGQGNTVVGCHVEHGLPTDANDVVPADKAICPFRFFSADGATVQDVVLMSNWPESQKSGAFVQAYRFENVRPAIGSWYNQGGCTSYYRKSGTILMPDNWTTLVSTSHFTDAHTRLRIDYVEGPWACDLPLLGDHRINKARMGTGGGYQDLAGGGVTYDPNPSGADIPWTYQTETDAAYSTQVTVTPEDASGKNFRIDLTATTRTDNRGAGGLSIHGASGIPDYPWALLTFDVDAPDDGLYFSYWTSSSQAYGQDALVRTQRGRVAVPLIDFKAGAGITFWAYKPTTLYVRNIRITPCAVF